MRIAAIELRNWLRFRGEHRIELEAKAYAVTGRWHDNPDRSNWSSKSSLCEAIDFALWGRHRHLTEDEWITRGESIGEVRVDLDDGSVIIRRRERGKRTTLTYQGPAATAGATRDEAQRIVADLVGLTAEDFTATCYFEQRQMARLVLADPSTRMSLVGGWLRLEPLERAADKASAKCAELAEQLAIHEAHVTAQQDIAKAALGALERAALEEQHVQASQRVGEAQLVLAKAQAIVEQNARVIGLRGTVQDYETLVAEGIKLRAQVDEEGIAEARRSHEESRARELEAAQHHRMSKAQLVEKRALSQGKFDGRCPVAGIECPATDQINQDRRRGLKLYEDAKHTADEAEAVYDQACRNEASTRLDLQERERLVSKLEAMREQASRMSSAYEAAKEAGEAHDPHVLRRRLDDAAVALDEARQAEAHLRMRLEHHARAIEASTTHIAKVTEVRAQVDVHRAAATVLGRQGAQRRIAEAALGEVEEAANAMLSEAGVDLQIQLRWSREGQGLARACPACGHPFPTSVKAKVCTRCKAARGHQLVNKLEVVLSDRSGAAEDLAGIFLQLAASEWLRQERGSSWGVAVVDEAFGALDVAHRRALGQAFSGALGRSFEQALVIAHSPEVLASFPGRIEVVANPEGSTVSIVA